MKKLTLAAILALSSTAFLAGGSAGSAETRKTEVNGDPNQIVCVREDVVGSRVATRRVCRTRAEWAEHQQQTRQVIERVQFNKQTFTQDGQ